MSASPIVTVAQGLEIEAWLEDREKGMRGQIKTLQNNLDQSVIARRHWQTKCYRLEDENRQLRKLRCRKRLIPVVKLLLEI